MNRCDRCGETLTPDDTYTHGGKSLCEDCYLAIMSVPRTCDPWAVYSAKRTSSGGQVLSPLQERILGLIRTIGPVSAQDICRMIGIGEEEFRNNFATLRHMELAKAAKGEDRILYKVFDS